MALLGDFGVSFGRSRAAGGPDYPSRRPLSLVICDGCRVLNAEGAYACANCGLPLSSTISPETPIVIAGRYRLMNVVGRGGMGTIYKAHDATLDEVVALKIVRPELARSETM